MESLEVITKRKLPESKKENIYLLSEKGIHLALILMGIVMWSDQYVWAYHPDMSPYDGVSTEKMVIIENAQNQYLELIS